MRVAIACTEKKFESAVESHFDKANWFCICDTQTKEQTFIQNPAIEKKEGSGDILAGKLAEQKIDMVIARSFDIKSSGYLREHNIQMVIPQVDINADKLIDQVKCF